MFVFFHICAYYWPDAILVTQLKSVKDYEKVFICVLHEFIAT